MPPQMGGLLLMAALLAGQAALAGQHDDTVTIATTNLAHLNRFPGIDAGTWDQKL
jgi:hypothetical protein